MLKNYLKIAVRNILKNKVYSFINIGGLAVGLSVCLLIFLNVQNDLSFDKFNKNYNRIYRVVQQAKQNNRDVVWSITPSGYSNAFQNEFHGVKAVRLSHPEIYTPVIKYGDKLFSTKNFIFADSTFFDIFTFPMIEGNPQTALEEPFSLVLTKTESEKIFGSTDPIGRIVRVSNLFDFKVTGVVDDPPPNSSIQFNYLASFVNIADVYKTQFHLNRPNVLDDFSASSYYTFILLPKNLSAGYIEKQLPSLVEKYLGTGSSKQIKLLIQHLRDIHFNTNYLWDFENISNAKYDYILSSIALFILLIACINFINISTAHSAARAKEVGIRKVLGANKLKIIRQFVLEFTLMTMLSAILSIVLAELMLPLFNSITGKHLALYLLNPSFTIFEVIAAWLLIVFAASAYPSIYLSSHQPAVVIRGISKIGIKGNLLRKSLITFQFIISVLLIAVTIVVWSQYNFLKLHNLGFNAQQVVYLPLNGELEKNYNVFKAQLLEEPTIKNSTIANWIPGDAKDFESYSWQDKTGLRTGSFFSLIVDPDFSKTLHLKIIAGRNFSRHLASDWKDSFILNETSAKMMGWTPEEALGQIIHSYHHDRRVIGVIRDFNFRSLQFGIEPVVMLMDSTGPYLETLIKISPQNVHGTIQFIQRTWKHFSPDFPFEYHFLNKSFEQLYKSEERLIEILGAFALLAILIASLGLFSLVSYMVQQRTKEIGIRKVLGASVPQVVNLITKDFIKLVLIANIIAWVPSYYFMSNWLMNFAYRINISLWIFIYAGVAALVIALVSISIHAIKAATANPVKSLRYE